MKNKKNQPLDFKNVCGIRAYLSIALQGEIKSRRESVQYWGASSPMVKMRNERVRDMISAYRAAKNIPIAS